MNKKAPQKNRFNTSKCEFCPKRQTCPKYQMLKTHKKQVTCNNLSFQPLKGCEQSEDTNEGVSEVANEYVKRILIIKKKNNKMKQNEINNETMTVNGTVENEVLTISTNEDKFLYDFRETRNNKREFYGFKNNFFENHRWLVAAYCDEVTLEEFVAKVKEIANTEKQYTCHGFNPNLFGMPNIGKYTVIVVKSKDTIEDSYDDLYIAKTKAIEYLYNDTCEYVSLIDNSTNKGLHFEPYNYAVISEDKYTGKTIIGFNELEAAKNMAQVCMAHKWNKNTKIVDSKMNVVNFN